MALYFTLARNGYGQISLVEITKRVIIKENADMIDLNRIRRKYENRLRQGIRNSLHSKI